MTRLFAPVLAILSTLLAATAHAQIAGNEHPETNLVTERGEITMPFGDPPSRSASSVEQKHAFAEALDLSPLRDLAVFHNGRVKILDTLAGETVQQLTGRGSYFDLGQAETSGRRPKLKYDAMFTLVDLVIDPAYYVDKPLLTIGYLPLRRALLETAFPDDQQTVEGWMKLTRVSPVMVARLGESMWVRYESQEPYRKALTNLDRRQQLFERSISNWALVAPESTDDVWHHLGEWGPETELGALTRRLGDDWRARDAAAVNAGIAELAAMLPNVNAELYPETKRNLEMAYNRANAFEWGFWAYALSLVALLLAFGTGRRWLVGVGITMLVTAVVLHGVGFTLRCIIAERFAIQNQFESMTGLSFFAAILGLAGMLKTRQWLFGAATAGMGFLVLITATQTGMPGESIEREAAILNTSVLLKYHVTTVLVSYGLITLGFIISLFYLGTHYLAKLKGNTPEVAEFAAVSMGADTQTAGSAPSSSAPGANAPKKPAGTARTLADLDTAHMTVLQLAFWTLGVGILLGAWWADHSWGRWWAFDPKETWALVTWIIYLMVIHLRFTAIKKKALTTAWLSVVGFFIMLWTYFGVNLLLPGLHAYA
ncbi:MAG: cytochrome c biogenesis protein CcsA [Planctomycetota bacterium]